MLPRGHHEISLDILTAEFSTRWPSASEGRRVRRVPAPGEVLFEKIAETGAVELEVRALRHGSTSAIGCSVSAGGSRATLLVPVRSEGIVFLAFLWIAQDLVSFIDAFELFLGRRLVFGHIRVELAGELAESLFDLGLRGVTGHAENLVVVLEISCHALGMFLWLSAGCKWRFRRGSGGLNGDGSNIGNRREVSEKSPRSGCETRLCRSR